MRRSKSQPPPSGGSPAQPKQAFPADPLERSQLRWAGLFFGVLNSIRRSAPELWPRLLLAFEKAGLDVAGWSGDAPDLPRSIPQLRKRRAALFVAHPRQDLFALNPTDDVLRAAVRFRAGSALPSLRGRIKKARFRPPYLSMLMAYYTELAKERKQRTQTSLKGRPAPAARAMQTVAMIFGYTDTAVAKHLERARKLHRTIAKIARRHGIQLVESL